MVKLSPKNQIQITLDDSQTDKWLGSETKHDERLRDGTLLDAV